MKTKEVGGANKLVHDDEHNTKQTVTEEAKGVRAAVGERVREKREGEVEEES